MSDPTPERILVNAARCTRCGDRVESTHRHDFVTCGCGALSVDGGRAYIRRCYRDLGDVEELSEYAPLGAESEDLTTPLPCGTMG
jgi:hypothetical protein